MCYGLKDPGNFLLVGGLTAIIYYLLVYVFYEVSRFHQLEAVSIAYAAAVIFHFVANRNITFGGRNGNTKSQATRYVILALLNYVVTLMVVSMSVKYLEMDIYFAAALAILTTLVTGYLGMKYWVFSPTPPEAR